MLFLDGVFVGNTFKESYAPSTESIDKLLYLLRVMMIIDRR